MVRSKGQYMIYHFSKDNIRSYVLNVVQQEQPLLMVLGH